MFLTSGKILTEGACPMKTITRKEELIMLSILNLREDAYLIAIHDHLSRITGKKVSLTSVHLPLSRMEKNGLVEGELGEATAVRGGRRKKIYRITKLGFEALEEYKKISDVLWANYANLAAR
jgi:PadR family transcriptional regulator PadR